MDIKAYIESGIIESYVLGLTTRDETAEVQARMEEYPEIRSAVTEFSLLYEKQALKGAVQPPDFVKSRTKAGLEAEFKEVPVKNLSENGASLWQQYRAVAAVLITVGSLAASIFFYNRSRDFEQRYNALVLEKSVLASNTRLLNEKVNSLGQQIRIVNSPATKAILLKGVKGKERALAKVYWDESTKEVYISAIQLDAPSSGNQYQLWAIIDGKPVDAGVLEDCGQELCKMKDITGAQAFAVTVEKAGGSPTPNLATLTVMGTL